MVIKILSYTDVSHTRAKPLLQDVAIIKDVCQNVVSQLVPCGGKNNLLLVTWALERAGHGLCYSTYPVASCSEPARQALSCFFFSQIL